MRQLPIKKLAAAAITVLGAWLAARYLLPIAMPFLLSAVLALAAEPLVRFFQRRLRLSRGAAAGLGVSAALLLTALALMTLGALLLRQLGALADVLPDLEGTAVQGLSSLEGFLLHLAAEAPKAVSPILTHGVEGFFSDSTALLDRVTDRLLGLASGVVTRIPDSALGFGTWLLACYMISAKLPAIRERMSRLLPESWQGQTVPTLKRLKKNLGGWLTAQLKLMGITFLVLCGGFLLLQITHAPLWAAAVSLVDALPILGTGTVLVPWALVCLLQGSTLQGVGLLGTYAVAALLRSVLEPRLVGRELGLDPLLTLIAMYTGYRLWGIGGMLLSPLLAVTAAQLLRPRPAAGENK